MSPRTIAQSFIITVILFSAPSAHATTWHVNGSCGNDAWTGMNEACVAPTGPYRTIGRAILAAVDGDTILVAPGTYNESINFSGKTITLQSIGGADVTIIDGTGIDDSVVLMIDDEGPATVFEGFTVTGGVGRLLNPGTGYRRGGGLYLLDASPTVRSCKFIGNSATDGGGALTRNDAALFVDCVFEDNVAEHGGGAHAAPDLQPVPLNQFVNCQFINNTATDRGGGLFLSGGDISRPLTITACTFSGNSAAYGGGVSRQNGSHRYVDCVFEDNSAGLGGATYSLVFQDDLLLSIEGCTFVANHASGGGAVHLLTDPFVFGAPLNNTIVIEQCDFVANTASVGGGAVYCDGADPLIANCGFESNAADAFLGAGGAIACINSEAQIETCIFRFCLAGYGGAISGEENGGFTVSFCEFEKCQARFGGAFGFFDDASAFVRDCSVSGTTATVDGAVAFVLESHGSFERCQFTDNAADSDEALFFRNSNAYVVMTEILNTGAVPKRVALRIEGESLLYVSHCSFEGHSGGIVVDDENQFTVEDSTFTNCTISGGIFGDRNSHGFINRCTFIGNGSGSGTGAIGGSNFTIADCMFEGNTGQSGFADALAIKGLYEGTVDVERCTFRNHAAFSLNAVVRSSHTLNLRDSIFENNASRDVAINRGEIEQCVFYSSALPIMVSQGGNALIKHCTFTDSQNHDMHIDFSARAHIVNCSFGAAGTSNLSINPNAKMTVFNSTFKGGRRLMNSLNINGAVAEFENCLILDKSNTFGSIGPANIMLRLRNCTIVNSSPVFAFSTGSPGVRATAANCIFSNSEPAMTPVDQLRISYSLITTGWPGIGNVQGNPAFVDAPNGDYRLKPGSKCIDAGSNNAVGFDVADLDDDDNTTEFVPVDLDGNPRFRDRAATPDTGCGVGAIVDMGAYERQQGAIDQPVFGDLDHDHLVAGFDLALLLGDWGACGGCCLGDLNSSGAVDGEDLALLLGAWTVN